MTIPRTLGAAFIALVSVAGPAGAREPLGTAGPYFRIAVIPCALGFEQQMKGACDPPQPDPALSPAERSAIQVERATKLQLMLRGEQARQALDEAIRLDPRNMAARSLKARMLLSDGAAGSAASEVNAALLIDPKEPDLLATRAYMLRREDLKRARQDADESLAIKPDSPDALWIRALILGDLEERDLALADLNRSLELDPEHRPTRFERARLHLQGGRPREALADADVLRKDDWGETDLRQLRAAARTALGDDAGAVEEITAALDPDGPPRFGPVDPHFAELTLQRAKLLVRLRRYEEAMRDIDAVVSRGGRQTVLQMQLYLRRNGFSDVAISGERSPAMDEALKACFGGPTCGRGMTIRH